MDNKNSGLLPHILEILSRKPNLRDTFDNLCHDIADSLADDNVNIKNVRKAIQNALNVGEKLGIVTLTDKDVRVPFNFHAPSKFPTLVKRSARGDMRRTNDYDDDEGNQLDDTASSEMVVKRRVHSVSKAPMDRIRRRTRVGRRVGARRARGRGKSIRSRSRSVSRRRR